MSITLCKSLGVGSISAHNSFGIAFVKTLYTAVEHAKKLKMNRAAFCYVEFYTEDTNK
jgi:hypothetical protein